MSQTPPGCGPGPGRPQVTGGAVSIEADLGDMRSVAWRLDRSGDTARDLGRQVMHVDGIPLRSSFLSPFTAGAVNLQMQALAYGPRGLHSLGIRIELVARGVRLGAGAYEAVERRRSAAFEAVQLSVGVPVVLTVVSGTAVTSVVQSVTEHPASWFTPQGFPRDRDPVADVVARFLRGLDATVYANPGIVDLAVAGGRWMLPPGPLEQQAGQLLVLLRAGGLARDDRPLTVTSVPLPQAGKAARSVGAADDPPAVGVATDAPGDLSGLLQTQSAIAAPSAAGAAGSRVRVQRVVGGDGQARWVVNIPGTQDWSLGSPTNPSDGPTNLAAVGGVAPRLYAAIAQAVAAAMRSAGVRPGSEPVLLSGHSQGGLVATRLAADPAFRRRFRVTSVLTAGSPVSRVDVPKDVRVLSLEHRSDLVPRLDQKADPDTVNRVRVVLDPSPLPGCAPESVIGVHDSDRYARSAAQQLARGSVRDPQLVQWYLDNDGFLRGRTTTYDFLIRRPPERP